MSHRGKSIFVCLMLVAASVWFQTWRGKTTQYPTTLATLASQAAPAAALQGEAAIQQLKTDGGYDSLAAAMAAARYQINAASTLSGNSAAPFYADNPGQQLRATFASDEVRVDAASNQTSGKTEGAELRLQLAGYGYGDQLEPLAAGQLTAHGDRITIRKSAIRNPQSAIEEWYVNKPEGLEQGFTLAAPPAGERQGEWLRVAMSVGDGWRASLRGDQQGAIFERQADGLRLSYDHLTAYDAQGRTLPARMSVGMAVDGDTLALLVDDARAVYPLTIDPLITQQRKLTAADGAAGDLFGLAVAISGNTAVIGAPSDDIGANVNQGSVHVFVRNGNSWSPQQKLTANGGAALDRFGTALALSGDTLAVSAPYANASRGTVYLFTRSGATWTPQQKLTANDGAANDNFGRAVALSGDTAVVSAPFDAIGTNENQGAVYVFTRSGTTWTPQLPKLTASGGAAGDLFGISVALSGDTLVVGAAGDDIGGIANQGAAYVFARNGTGWSQQRHLFAEDGVANDGFGGAVALSGDTVVVGASSDDSGASADQGSAYVFVCPACPIVTLNPATLPGAQIGTSYSQSVTASGGAGPFQFSLSEGALPPGLILAQNGLLSGTPTTAGAYRFTITATILDSLCPGSRSYTLNVQQDCSTFIINPALQNFAAAGGSGSVSVTAGAGCAWTAASNASWITLGNFGGTGSGAVGFVVAANPGAARTGQILVAGQTFTVNQAAFNCTYTLSPASINVTAQGGPGSVDVTTQSGCSWSAVSNASWITITAGANGTGNGTFSFSITVSSGASPRTGTVTAGGQTFTVNQDGAAQPATGLQFYPLPRPIRLLDTRAGQIGCDAPGAPIAGQTERTQLARRVCNGVTIPNDAMAVTGNITTVNSGGGFLTLFPSNAARPLAAGTNYAANEVVNNVFTVGLGADGAFKIFAFNTTDVVVDITGYYAPPGAANPGGLYFHPLPKPIRLLETRAGFTGCNTPGAPIQGGADTSQQARLTCDGVTIPAAAQAIVGNATTVSPAGPGFLTLFPANASRPLAASSNYGTNQVVNGPFTVGLSAAGEFNIFTQATTHLVVDVLGYYSAEASDLNGPGLLFNPLSKPVRLLETRPGQTGCFTPGAPLSANTEQLQIAHGSCQGETIPAAALVIVGNATVVNPQGGYLTFWPSNAVKPLVATSNFNAGQVFNRHFIVGLGPDGALKMYSQLQTDLVVDVAGYFAP